MSASGHFDTEKSGCRMTGEVSRDAENLKIQFTFHNGSSNTAFLFDGVYRPQGNEFDTNQNLVYVEPSGSRVVLGKKLIPVPEGMLVEKKIVPLCTKVAPGQRVERSLEIPLPLTPWTPYLTADSSREKRIAELGETVDGYFELGFILTPPEGAALAQRATIQDRELWRFDAVSPEKQIILRAGPISELPFKKP